MPIVFQNGSLSCQYEKGFFRYLKVGETEVLRMLYFALRDHNWGTLPLEIVSENIHQGAKGFTVDFVGKSSFKAKDILLWKGSVIGKEDASIEFHLTATFLTDFSSNRVGFCVLHPLAGTKGQNFQVKHSDGREETSKFPELIAPHQPCFDIRALSWSTSSGVEAKLAFEGDTFEMEDQRNWTDASYKTYCTPLSIPFPVQRKAGEKIEQSIFFTVNPQGVQRTKGNKDRPVQLEVDLDQQYAIPNIGTCWPIHRDQLSIPTQGLLKKIELKSLRVDIHEHDTERSENWELIQSACEQLRAKIHLYIHGSQAGIARKLLELKQYLPQDKLELICPIELYQAVPSPQFSAACLPLLRTHYPDAKIGLGSPYYFTQLNRNRREATWADCIFFANSAQVHAFDEASIIETLLGQSETVTSARALYPGLPVHVSPVSLFARLNPDAKNQKTKAELSYAFPPDSRQSSAFIAGWTLACLAYLTRAGAAQVDFFELFGPRGLLHEQEESPAFQVLTHLSTQAFEQIFATLTDQPLRISALAGKRGNDVGLYLINHKNERISIQVPERFIGIYEQVYDLTVNGLPKQVETDSKGFISIPSYGVVYRKFTHSQ